MRHCKTKEHQKAFEEKYAKDKEKRELGGREAFVDELVDHVERKRPRKRFYR